MKRIILIIGIYCMTGCTGKLDLKPDSSLILPQKVKDFETLLENTDVMNITPALAQLSADEYYIPNYEAYLSSTIETQRNAYEWQQDIFGGATSVLDWRFPYYQVFYCNSILDLLDKKDFQNDSEFMRIKGWALFNRAYAFYMLLSIFAKGYEPSTANFDLGIPLKLTSDINEILPRSNIQDSYDQIIKDALAASELLQQDIIADKRNRPSKVAAYALLARVYLSMRIYDKAEVYVDKTLSLYSKLTDFNSLKISTSSSFTYNAEETIYFSLQVTAYSSTTYDSSTAIYALDTLLMDLYDISDLRKSAYFTKNPAGHYIANKGINSSSRIPFTGLATDEMYLIKAECLARRNQTQQAMDFLNQLVAKRWNPNATVPAKPYLNITANTPQTALDKVLIERRKSLVWRGLRWTDLKRLNLEGRNIILKRNLNGQEYILEPNSPRYALPIPQYEIALSGVEQNIR